MLRVCLRFSSECEDKHLNQSEPDRVKVTNQLEGDSQTRFDLLTSAIGLSYTSSVRWLPWRSAASLCSACSGLQGAAEP